MTFMIDPASNQVNQAEGTKILEKLWELSHGPNYLEIPEELRKYIKANNSFSVGMDEMWHRFNSGRLLLSNNLRSLLDQYESYSWNKDGTGPRDETDEIRYDIITALRYCVMGLSQHAHRLDMAPPWLYEDEPSGLDIKDWIPYRAGRG